MLLAGEREEGDRPRSCSRGSWARQRDQADSRCLLPLINRDTGSSGGWEAEVDCDDEGGRSFWAWDCEATVWEV